MTHLDWLEPQEYAAWRSRITAEHKARHLTHARRAALLALVTCLSANVEPTDANVAALACTSTRTVRRARHDARELGLLSWERTRRVIGGRWRQGVNAYVLAIPSAPVCSGGQAGRASKVRKKERKPTRALMEVPAGFPTLAAIAERRRVALWGSSTRDKS